ncbi:hypothetical protein NKH18_50185 [Streptomyces sp. M10(2022)]
MLEKTGQHIWMCAVVIAVSLIVAVPVGLWLGHLHRGNSSPPASPTSGAPCPTWPSSPSGWASSASISRTSPWRS